MDRGRILNQIIKFPDACRESRLPMFDPRFHILSEQGICAAGISELVAGYDIRRSNTDFYLVIFTFEGKAVFTCGSKTIYPEAGTVMIAPPGVKHHYMAGKKWDMLWFHLKENSYWHFLNEKGFYSMNFVYGEQLRYAINQIVTESLAEKVDANMLIRMYSEMLLVYLRRELTESGEKNAQRSAQFNKLWEQVNNDPAAVWTLDKMAHKMYLSPSHFSRQCRQLYNLSPLKMVSRIRLRYACELLNNTNYSLAVIAEKVGYDNAFSFSSAFKKNIGISPKHFRK